MGKRDPKTAAYMTNGTNTTGKKTHEGHKTTAATIAKVAAAQEEVKQSLEPLGKSEQPPKAPPKDLKKLLKGQQPPFGGRSNMSPGASQTATAIQRIAENGAPPLKLSTNPSGQSSKPRKGSSKSSKSASKSSTSLNSVSPSSVRHHSSPSSPGSENAPPLPQRPRPQRSSSAEGASLLSIVKKGKEQIQSDGSKVAKFFGKKSHEAWDKIKKQKEKESKSQKFVCERRDTSNDIDVFGMELKDAVLKTRVANDRKMVGDGAYWMPALAYRCLQYLNVHGPHELGIYRISGSTSVVDELRADFKIHHDIDLFDNPPDDLHTVSSLLKGWFRSLPEAILPNDVQKRVYEKCKDMTDAIKPPQAFVDELSNLPPYNYYLLHHLFSHLSAICGASDVNKMGLANLGMIFCSTLRIDRFCFNWLVNSWSDCWAGCLTEEEEYERTLPPPPRRNPSITSSASHNYNRYNQSSPIPSEPRSRSAGRADTMPNSSVDRWPSNGSSNRQLSNKSPVLSSGRSRSTSKAGTDRLIEAEKDLEREIRRRRDQDMAMSRERSKETQRSKTDLSEYEDWKDALENVPPSSTPTPPPFVPRHPTPPMNGKKEKPRARSPEGSRSAIRMQDIEELNKLALRKKDIDEISNLRIETNTNFQPPRSPAGKSPGGKFSIHSNQSDQLSLNVETGCTPRGSISSERNGKNSGKNSPAMLGMPLPRIEPISPMLKEGGML
ncbi:uncharacterized protein LAJ45_08522 [Morchella importuna]|uniref:uncharacterized protein n=1 Tax=Morchella importuna TaxID=1174673 RepID=UPI001E8E0571|nr:uncharacterized protein LAJ45_08522 [Morchella importuna]KAH8147366.1 hypothetical protein LAJ45_08522 [Morchella importuna]